MAKITINRPEVRNAFRPQTLFELSDAFNLARDNDQVGVIIFTGAGDEAFVVLGLRDESRRGLGIDELRDALVQVGRVHEEGEVGPQRLVVGCVDPGIGGGSGVRAQAGAEVAAGREADHADAVAGDVPFGGAATDDPDGALDVLIGAVLVPGDAVLEDDPGDAEGIEPSRDFGAFLVVGEDAVTAARADDDRWGGLLGVGRHVDGEGRLGDVG